MENNINRVHKGLFTDTEPIDQPKESYRFALNAEIDETSSLANEKGNELCFNIPAGLHLIGDVSIGNNEAVVFLASLDQSISEIAIVDTFCNYTAILTQQALNFNTAYRIDAVYRLRKGCERVIYFTDGYNKPRYYNIDKPNDVFLNTPFGVFFSVDKLNLFKTYDSKPALISAEIIEEGQVASGSYLFSLQYLDSDFNPTEFVDSWGPVKIYNDSETSKYSSIRGSTNIKNGMQDFALTNKAIRLTFKNLSANYAFYRVAIVAFENGSGRISKVLYSNAQPTENKVFTYTGQENFSTGTIEEVQFFAGIIEKASHIEQIENKLLLLNTKGTSFDMCSLQSYASKILADCILKEVYLDEINEHSSKKGAQFIDGASYMPGEIYSKGIVYVFKDGTTSPAFHIPGKNTTLYPTQKHTPFSPGTGVYAMASDNASEELYFKKPCGESSYWSTDAHGHTLQGQPIRHHRFPTREMIEDRFITKSVETQEVTFNTLKVKFSNWASADPEEIYGYFHISFKVDGIYQEIEYAVYKYEVLSEAPLPFIATVYKGPEDAVITDISIYELGISSSYLTTETLVSSVTETTTSTRTKVNIFGLKLSNIIKPHADIVGYYIVSQERTDANKTVLDGAVLFPFMEDSKYYASAHLVPTLTTNTKICNDVAMLYNPEFKFLGKEFRNFTEIVKEGDFNIIAQPTVTSCLIQDVGVGSSYDPKIHKKSAADYDGYSLHAAVRETVVEFEKQEDNTLLTGTAIKEVNYLDALSSKIITLLSNAKKELFNASGDNKVGYIQTVGDLGDFKNLLFKKIPYVKLKRSLATPYSNFTTVPYYKSTVNMQLFQEEGNAEVTVFGGDTHITPHRIFSSVYNNLKLYARETKKSFKYYLAASLATLATVAAALVAAGTFGAAGAVLAPAVAAAWIGVSAIGASVAISALSAGLKMDNVNRVYNEIYEEGLRETLSDNVTKELFDNLLPNLTIFDEEIQWLGDCVSDVWIESQVNASLRQGNTVKNLDFLNPLEAYIPKNYSGKALNSDHRGHMSEYNALRTKLAQKGVYSGVNAIFTEEAKNSLEQYLVNKITVTDADNSDGRLYTGFALAEFYSLNKDYLVNNLGKFYFALGIEYDCCSECQEEFPHRVQWSEQSYKEESKDNYRVFLPNNYRDIEGETGAITDAFRIQNTLFIHTEEALWELPAATQERITGQIISFIGTGEFFSQPPRKVLELNTGGTKNKWATLKTPFGVFFVSRDRVYLLAEKGAQPISLNGLGEWFKKNLTLTAVEQFKKATKEEYPFLNVLSNKLGVGFISVYDREHERIILTKRDFSFPQYALDELALNGYRIEGEELYIKDNGGGERRFDKTTIINNSWTLSYSLKRQTWTSFHSYLPEYYLSINEKVFSAYEDQLWIHNVKALFQSFYGLKKDFIIEYVSVSNPITSRIWNALRLETTAYKFDTESNVFEPQRDITFNRVILYNAKQCSGLLELLPRDAAEDFFKAHTTNSGTGAILIEQEEGSWYLNDLRDIKVSADIPTWNHSLASLQADYYIDKVLNQSTLDFEKEWYEQEMFREKYLSIRLIFNTFVNVKLLFNFSLEDEAPSFR